MAMGKAPGSDDSSEEDEPIAVTLSTSSGGGDKSPAEDLDQAVVRPLAVCMASGGGWRDWRLT